MPKAGAVLKIALAVGVASAVVSLWHVAQPSAALQGGGVVTGQVVWCSGIYGFAVGVGAAIPGQEGGQIAPQAPEAPSPQILPDDSTFPGGRPIPGPRPEPRIIPAGAVLVAVQGTALSARTNESGRFRIENVPVGQYLTVGAGPVRGVSDSTVLRPNVFVQNASQMVDLGRLSLGQPCVFGPTPLGAPDGPQVAPGDEISPTIPGPAPQPGGPPRETP